MLSVTLDEFRANPDAYINLVAHGEPITIQQRGMTVAQLQPPPRPSSAEVRMALEQIKAIRREIACNLSLPEIKKMIEEGRE